jgi:hypothetical protein
MRPFLLLLTPLMACEATDFNALWAEADPFADAVVSFSPGPAAGFGQQGLPDVVLGPPQGKGPTAGGLDVLSLGEFGEIILELSDIVLVDGPGPDLIIFENPFPGWQELATVSVSEDGEVWQQWLCDANDPDGLFEGCAGVAPVLSHPSNGLDPTAPDTAGGDLFDLADLAVSTARFVRIRDVGTQPAEGITGGFDLDAISVIHWREQE